MFRQMRPSRRRASETRRQAASQTQRAPAITVRPSRAPQAQHQDAEGVQWCTCHSCNDKCARPLLVDVRYLPNPTCRGIDQSSIPRATRSRCSKRVEAHRAAVGRHTQMPNRQPRLRPLHQNACSHPPTNSFRAVPTSRCALLARRVGLTNHPLRRHETTRKHASTRMPRRRRSLVGRRGCHQHQQIPNDKKRAAIVCRRPTPSEQSRQSVGPNRCRKPTTVFARYQAATAGGRLPDEQCAREKMALQAHRKATPQKWCCA